MFQKIIFIVILAILVIALGYFFLLAKPDVSSQQPQKRQTENSEDIQKITENINVQNVYVDPISITINEAYLRSEYIEGQGLKIMVDGEMLREIYVSRR